MSSIIELPKKDKQGMGLLSYSQIDLFKRNKGEYYQRYVLGSPFVQNIYTEFGNKVGGALESGDFSKFSEKEQGVLKQVVRLDEFEKKVTLQYSEYGFSVVGYIDTSSSDYLRIIDYKTGGTGKHAQYESSEYKQLVYYALGLRHQYGVTPKVAQVQFIERWGNPKRGDELRVGLTKPLLIDIDISMNSLKKVYWETIEIAKEISEFYQQHKPKDNSLLPTLE